MVYLAHCTINVCGNMHLTQRHKPACHSARARLHTRDAKFFTWNYGKSPLAIKPVSVFAGSRSTYLLSSHVRAPS